MKLNYKNMLISALQKRIDHCLEDLNIIMQGSNTKITKGNNGIIISNGTDHFSQSAYKTMLNLVEKIDKSKSTTIDFTSEELTQLVKAVGASTMADAFIMSVLVDSLVAELWAEFSRRGT